jgi:hypothetical protein
MKSKMMPIVALLSVTEAELFAATCCAQDMLFEMRILEAMGLKVKKPMILNVDLVVEPGTLKSNNCSYENSKSPRSLTPIGFQKKKCEAISTRRIFQVKHGSKFVGNDRCMKIENE